MHTDPRAQACILLVEDEPVIREALTELLQDEGYSIVGVANGREACDYVAAAATPPALILLDLLMPVMDGREFLDARLRQPALAAIPVVLLSAFDPEHLELPKQTIAGYLPKPLQLDSVLDVLERYCPADAP